MLSLGTEIHNSQHLNRRKRPTCSSCLEAGLTHLILELLVLCGDGLPDGDKASHSHTHCLAHPVYGRLGTLRLLWLVLMVDQSCDLQKSVEKGK